MMNQEAVEELQGIDTEVYALVRRLSELEKRRRELVSGKLCAEESAKKTVCRGRTFPKLPEKLIEVNADPFPYLTALTMLEQVVLTMPTLYDLLEVIRKANETKVLLKTENFQTPPEVSAPGLVALGFTVKKKKNGVLVKWGTASKRPVVFDLARHIREDVDEENVVEQSENVVEQSTERQRLPLSLVCAVTACFNRWQPVHALLRRVLVDPYLGEVVNEAWRTAMDGCDRVECSSSLMYDSPLEPWDPAEALKRGVFIRFTPTQLERPQVQGHGRSYYMPLQTRSAPEFKRSCDVIPYLRSLGFAVVLDTTKWPEDTQCNYGLHVIWSLEGTLTPYSPSLPSDPIHREVHNRFDDSSGILYDLASHLRAVSLETAAASDY